MRLELTSVTRGVRASPESQKGESWLILIFYFRRERGLRAVRANKEPMIAPAQTAVVDTDSSNGLV